MPGPDKSRSDGAFEVIGNVKAAIDRWVIPLGWMFGLMFVGFGLRPALTEGGGNVGLLALGFALIALSRASDAAGYARRHACRCEGRDARPGGAATGDATGAGEAPR